MPIYSVTLKEGESIVLPANARLVTVIQDGATLTSSCNGGVPVNAEEYRCYNMQWGYSTTSGNDAALEDDAGVVLESMTIGGVEYELNIWANNAISPIKGMMESILPQAIFKIYAGRKVANDRRADFYLKFKTIPSLADSIKMKITGLSFGNGLYVTAVRDTDCNCYSSGERVCDEDEDGGIA